MVEFIKLSTPVMSWVSKVETGDYLLETMHWKQIQVVNKSIGDFSLSILVISESIDNFISSLFVVRFTLRGNFSYQVELCF